MTSVDPRSPAGYVPVPGADTKVWQLFDETLGYDALHAIARARRPRQAVGRHDDLLQRRYAIVPAVTAAEAARIKDLVFTPDGVNRCGQLTMTEMAGLFATLFAGPLDDAIVALLQADYFPMFVGGSVASPDDGGGGDMGDVSYRWHCDLGPHSHLKVLLYLDEPDGHDGATVVLDRETTDRFKAAGYVFDLLDKRVADIGPVAEANGIAPPQPVVCRPGQGAAILFEPTNVLHRGQQPSFGKRHMLSVGIVPFPYDYRSVLPGTFEQIRTNGGFDFADMTGIVAGFH